MKRKVPITSVTSERAFFTLRRVYSYLHSSMTEKRLNDFVVLHVHQDLTDEMDPVTIAKQFISLNNDRKSYFGTFP